MAITTAWTTTIAAHKLPDGFTVPTVAELVDPAKESGVSNIARTVFQNASAVTGWTNLGDAVKSDIDTNVIPGLGLDAAADIDGRIVITKVEHAHSAFEMDDLPNIAKTSTSQVRVYWEFQWVATV